MPTNLESRIARKIQQIKENNNLLCPNCGGDWFEIINLLKFTQEGGDIRYIPGQQPFIADRKPAGSTFKCAKCSKFLEMDYTKRPSKLKILDII